MSDVIEVSYTGDILAHRRCPRAWAYEKHAGFVPYEQVQAMEGRLLHHAMEWLSRQYRETGVLVARSALVEQLGRFYKVLRARGVTTAFAGKDELLDRIVDNLYDGESMRRPVSAVVRGAEHTEYELRAVRKVLPASYGGKSRILLTGVIDLVLQQQDALTYERVWHWLDTDELTGEVRQQRVHAEPGDVEIWDFKATKASTSYLVDYVRQVVTYSALYRERTGDLPKRCVLFFVNERNRTNGLLAVPIDGDLVARGVVWTETQVAELRKTVAEFEQAPESVAGGSPFLRLRPVGQRVTDDLKPQCTGCPQRFDCDEYLAFLGCSGTSRSATSIRAQSVGTSRVRACTGGVRRRLQAPIGSSSDQVPGLPRSGGRQAP